MVEFPGEVMPEASLALREAMRKRFGRKRSIVCTLQQSVCEKILNQIITKGNSPNARF